jgi:hypothetical protein
VVGSLAYLVEALCIGVAPYLGSVAGVSAAMVGLGVANGFANVLTITAFQRWAPPGTLGRLTGLLMLTSFGIFPLSVAIAAIFVRDLGPAPFFLFAAATLAAAILAGLTQRAWRDFGAPASDLGAEHPAPPPSNPAPSTQRRSRSPSRKSLKPSPLTNRGPTCLTRRAQPPGRPSRRLRTKRGQRIVDGCVHPRVHNYPRS